MSCPTGKVQYFSRKAARTRARRMYDSALGAYKCEACDWFHLGHKPQRVRNGEVDKADWLESKKQPAQPPRPAPAAPFTPADMARRAGRRGA